MMSADGLSALAGTEEATSHAEKVPYLADCKSESAPSPRDRLWGNARPYECRQREQIRCRKQASLCADRGRVSECRQHADTDCVLPARQQCEREVPQRTARKRSLAALYCCSGAGKHAHLRD